MSNQINEVMDACEKKRATRVQIEDEWICEQLLGWSRSEQRPGWWTRKGSESSPQQLPKFSEWEHCVLILDEFQARVLRARNDIFANAVLRQLSTYLSCGRLTPTSIRDAAITYLVTVNAEKNCPCCRPEQKCPDHGPSLTGDI